MASNIIIIIIIVVVLVSIGQGGLTPDDARGAVVFRRVFAELFVFLARSPLVVLVAFAIDRPEVVLHVRSTVTAHHVARRLGHHQLRVDTSLVVL